MSRLSREEMDSYAIYCMSASNTIDKNLEGIKKCITAIGSDDFISGTATTQFKEQLKPIQNMLSNANAKFEKLRKATVKLSEVYGEKQKVTDKAFNKAQDDITALAIKMKTGKN